MDYYRTLQVSRDAEPEVIERAYKALARKYHPDSADSARQAQATAQMQSINAAYAVLKDPGKRRAYDATLPPLGQDQHAWDVFLNKGLVGMFLDRIARD